MNAVGWHKFLVAELSDVETGPMSDMGYVRAELNADGVLELFDTDEESAWPVASFDVHQLAAAVFWQINAK